VAADDIGLAPVDVAADDIGLAPVDVAAEHSDVAPIAVAADDIGLAPIDVVAEHSDVAPIAVAADDIGLSPIDVAAVVDEGRCSRCANARLMSARFCPFCGLSFQAPTVTPSRTELPPLAEQWADAAERPIPRHESDSRHSVGWVPSSRELGMVSEAAARVPEPISVYAPAGAPVAPLPRIPIRPTHWSWAQ
jgi:hypothetical protein